MGHGKPGRRWIRAGGRPWEDQLCISQLVCSPCGALGSPAFPRVPLPPPAADATTQRQSSRSYLPTPAHQLLAFPRPAQHVQITCLPPGPLTLSVAWTGNQLIFVAWAAQSQSAPTKGPAGYSCFQTLLAPMCLLLLVHTPGVMMRPTGLIT